MLWQEDFVTILHCRLPSLTGARRAALDAHRLAVRDLLTTLPHDVLDIRPHRLGNLNTPADFAA
jgi:molybdopterin-guanine dinucleotide biosynthesis protein A